MVIKIAPSLERADWLNFERDIHLLEEAGVDLLHLDIMDRTYGETILLSPNLIPAIKKITKIPLDIHLYVSDPLYYFPQLFESCKNDYINIEIEAVQGISKLLTLIKENECLSAVTLDIGTSIQVLEELVPQIDMVNILVRNSGVPLQQLSKQILDKVERVSKMFKAYGKEIDIEVDGSINFEDAKLLKEKGANIFVLGSKVVFRKGYTFKENCDKFHEYLSGDIKS